MNAEPLDLPVAILAGGLAQRLRPLTEKIPKALLQVGGRPFLAHQLELLSERGIRRVVLCLGHLGERVVQEFGDGQAWNVQLDYSFDGPVLLGTGGAIRQALPKLGPRFFILYGDSYLTAPLHPLVSAFERSGKRGLMTVYRNEGCYDASNVVFVDGQIEVYDKRRRRPEMRHIDYGLSLVCAQVFEEWPAQQNFDLAEVMGNLVSQRQLAGYEVPDRFYEIGSPAGLAELEALVKNRRPR